ncbi:MAG: thioesterase family protein [Thermoplasmataceae archaeon]
MSEYKSVLKIQVRYGDMDTLGHANNAVYFTYFELGRIDLLRKNGLLREIESINFVLARVEADYLKPITLFSMPVLETYISRTGNTSVTFDHVILELGTEEVYCRGKTIAVFMKDGQKTPVPVEIRRIASDHAGAML